MKKILTFLGIIIVTFGAIAFLTNMQDDDYYKNAITPEKLADELASDESVTVYFYGENCVYCQKASPVVVPMADDLDIDLKVYNVDEYEQGWDDFELDGTPTIIHFENGQEVDRIVGYDEKEGEEVFKQWFETTVLGK